MSHIRIKIVQYMWGPQNLSYDLNRKINKAYCERHGYEHVVRTHPPRTDRSAHWEKIPTIRRELFDCDFLFFLDADAFFYSQELTLEDELLAYLHHEKDILIAADYASEYLRNHPDLPNTGVILFRNNENVAEILRIWDESSDRPGFEKLRFECFHEQEALWRTVWIEFRDSFQLVKDYYLMNGYFGVFIRHLMAMSDAGRSAVLQKFISEKQIPIISDQVS